MVKEIKKSNKYEQKQQEKPLVNSSSSRENSFINAERKTRDVLCLVLFFVFWIGMIVIASVALETGKPKRLIYPIDYQGNMCNKTNPVIYYPHPDTDFHSSAARGLLDPYKVPYYGVCVPECPENFISHFHRCVPVNSSSVSVYYNYVFGYSGSAARFLMRYVEDLRRTIKIILIYGVGYSILLAVIYLALLRICPSVIVYITIFMGYSLLLISFIICGIKGNIFVDDKISIYTSRYVAIHKSQNVIYYKITTYILGLCNILYILVFLFMYTRINLAMGIIKEAIKALSSIPSLFIFPIFPSGLVILLLLYFIVISAYIVTSKEITLKQLETKAHIAFNYYDNTKNHMWLVFIYNLYGVIWTEQLIEGILICTISGSICSYYWTEQKSNLNVFTVLKSLYRTIRYSFGSIALGSSIIAFVQTLRIILEYIDRKTRNLQNSFIKMIICCCKLCLWFLNTILKYLTINGYIIISMKGTSFCESVKYAFQLVVANAGRVATVGILSSYILFVGRIFICMACCLLTYSYLINGNGKFIELTSPFPTLITVGILSYGITYMKFALVEISIDTILFSVCEDEKINSSTGKYYATSSIKAYLDVAETRAFNEYTTKEEPIESNNIYPKI